MNKTMHSEIGSINEGSKDGRLLTLINEAAVLLLTVGTDLFGDTITDIMGSIATLLGADHIYLWRVGERDGNPVYIKIYGWNSPDAGGIEEPAAGAGSNIIPRISEWDKKMFGEQGYMLESIDGFTESIYENLYKIGIKSVMAFPVSFQGKYWGFLSFESRSSKKLCSVSEANILKSGSVMLANAVIRNESMEQVSERLRQQQLMSDISKSFITREPMANLINDALSRMGAFLNVVRALIAVFEEGSDVSHPEYCWFASPEYAPNQSQKGFSSILKEFLPPSHALNGDNPIVFCDNTLTYMDGKFNIFYENCGIKSLVCAPIYIDSKLWGVMSIEEHETFRHWSENDAQLVSTVTSAISTAVARDIMERERAAALEQALAASRAKSDFLSNMSHEIRTPMNAITGMTSIGLSTSDPERMLYCFSKINNASKHLLGIINDILDISKIEANKLELSSASFVFEKMLQQVVSFINFRVDERRQHLYISIDKNIPHSLIGDDQRLAQVITNLLANAVKFTPEEGAIYLEARLLNEVDGVCQIQVSVADSGIGILEEQISHLFEAFEQANAGTTREFGGTGLGLAISKRIIEMMGGEIQVESEPQKGSRFTFTVLLARDCSEQKRLLDENVNWENIRIFAVDDEPEIREFFLNLADSIGISCTVAGSGEEAMQALSQDNDYDMYFIDWKLPGMNGIKLAESIHTSPEHKSVVIIFSSTDWSFIEHDALDAGVYKFLPKPLFQSTIIDIITDCINSSDEQPEGEAAGAMDCFDGHSVLLVEDIEINREIIITLLEDTMIEIDCAENGAEAVEMFSKYPNKYDIVFMDVQMPVVDGYEATRRIRALSVPRAKTTPIIAMTANVFREDIEKCLESGMNDHIGKPLIIDDLMSILRKHCR